MNSLVDEVRWVLLRIHVTVSGQHYHHCRMSFYSDHKSVIWTAKWFTPGTALVLMCYTMSLPLPLNNYSATATEMPDELDNYVICQMWIQTGLKWPKDKGVCRQNDDFVWQRKSLTRLFSIELRSWGKKGPAIVLLNHLWGLKCALQTFFMWYLMSFFCLRQANRGEGGGDFSTAGDLCWESPATSEQTYALFIHLFT